MSSSKHTPFQDLTNGQTKDPKELKGQRDRELYAKNKDEIAKRRRQMRELKKQSNEIVNDDDTLCDTQATGEDHMVPCFCMAPDVQLYASQNHGSIPFVAGDDESDWLRRNNTYQMIVKPGGRRPNLIAQTNLIAAGSLSQLSGVDDIMGRNNVDLQQPGASSSNNHLYPSRHGKKQQTGLGWYARLSDERKAAYLQRQRIARQQKKKNCNKEWCRGVSNISCFFTEFTAYPIKQRDQHTNKWDMCICKPDEY